MRRGFTLVEVVVALVFLEIGLMGGVGLIAVARGVMTRAERLDALVALAEGVADSLAASDSVGAGSRSLDGSFIEWGAAANGVLTVRASSLGGGVVELLAIRAADATREP